MISRRNFITITLLMFVLFFMCMFSGAYKDSLNEYDVNMYADTQEMRDFMKQYLPKQVFKTTEPEETESNYVLFVGTNLNLRTTANEWCRYQRTPFRSVSSCTESGVDFDYPPRLILIEGAHLTVDDIPVIDAWTKKGIDLVFCNMPPLDIALRKDMKLLMGLRSVREEPVDLMGIVLHPGFLLGGGYTYQAKDEATEKMQDLKLTTTWYEMASGTKAYMTGLLDEAIYGQVQNEYLPAIVWRNSVGNAKVFVVNGDYMETAVGLGFLSAFDYETKDHSLYPVMNAQNMVIVNYPSFTPENQAEMERLYNRDSYRVLRELVWPGLIAVLVNTDSKMTCMLNTKMDYENPAEPSREDLIFFMKLLREQEAEAGLSCEQTSATLLLQKMNVDEAFLLQNLPDYSFRTAYVADYEPELMGNVLHRSNFLDVHTYLRNFKEGKEIVYLTDGGEVVLSTINHGDSHMFSEDLREKSVETALGYSVVTQDLAHIIYPQSEADQWQHVYKEFAIYTDTFYDAFDAFDELTLSESAERAKLFLTTEYKEQREGDTVTLESCYNKGYYILRTHGEEIDEISGGDYKEIEEDAFLISLDSKKVTIRLKEKTRRRIFGKEL